MSRLRSEISPKLLTLGELLLQPLSKMAGEELYIHLAKHLRRTVNPPVTTWVAFARTKRAYKPTVHFRVALSAEGLRTMVFVEDYAEDKLKFADALCSNSSQLAEHLSHHPSIKSYSIPDMVSRADELHLIDLSERLRKIKSQHAVFGIELAGKKLLKLEDQAIIRSVLKSVKELLPIYDCGLANPILT